MPAAAPISGVAVKLWPRPESAVPYELMKSGSAEVVAVLRCEALGSAIAFGRVMPKSRSLTSTCSTVVMIVDPPGEPSATIGAPFVRDYCRAHAAPRALAAIRGVGESRHRLEVR